MNKCFLAKSPVGSLPFVHRDFPIVGKFPCERGFYRARRQRRGTLLGSFHFRSKSVVLLAELNLRGEGNVTLLGSFLGVPKKRRSNFFGVRLRELSSVARLRESPHFSSHFLCGICSNDQNRRFRPPVLRFSRAAEAARPPRQKIPAPVCSRPLDKRRPFAV